MAGRTKQGSEDNRPVVRLVVGCCAGLKTLYEAHAGCDEGIDRHSVYLQCVRYIARLLAIMVAAERIPDTRSASDAVKVASKALMDASQGAGSGNQRDFEHAARAAAEASGIGLLAASGSIAPDESVFNEITRILLGPYPSAEIDPLFFQSMPLSWIGVCYQAMLDLHPSETSAELIPNRSRRKGRGVFYTPPPLVAYVVESAVGAVAKESFSRLDCSIAEALREVRVLDPAMGGGDFLTAAQELISKRASDGDSDSADALRAIVAANCVYGIDIDPVAVEIARFCVWAESGFADGISDSINKHLVCGNALSEFEFEWDSAFGEAVTPGFAAVVGNPPYVASKNGVIQGGRGQSDLYLQFVELVLNRKLVKPGGMLSMVLPDPFIARGNAAAVRRRLAAEWTIESLLHVAGAFPEANVANVVPVFRNAHSVAYTFGASRIERIADWRDFVIRPHETAKEIARPVRRDVILAQERCELLYLLEDGPMCELIRRIHGDSLSLTNYEPPFAPLRSLNVWSIFRGEEVGKAAIGDENGDLPMLLGGESVQPYEIIWEGRKTAGTTVRKSLDRYLRTKVVIQKSSAHVIAAIDRVDRRHGGYVFPQSVYAVELGEPGMGLFYLLCILNSEVMNEYIHRTVTGYKLVQPQLEIEDIKGFPIRRVQFITPSGRRREELARGIQLFEDETLRVGNGEPFARLGAFATQCLAANPERSDVVHDLLVHLGKMVTDLTRSSRKAPDAEKTRRLEFARRAIETVVWQLYSSEPAQMALAL